MYAGLSRWCMSEVVLKGHVMIKFTWCAKTNKNLAVNVAVSPLVIKLRMIRLFVFC